MPQLGAAARAGYSSAPSRRRQGAVSDRSTVLRFSLRRAPTGGREWITPSNSAIPGKHTVGIGIVIAMHVLLAWALVSGLGAQGRRRDQGADRDQDHRGGAAAAAAAAREPAAAAEVRAAAAVLRAAARGRQSTTRRRRRPSPSRARRRRRRRRCRSRRRPARRRRRHRRRRRRRRCALRRRRSPTSRPAHRSRKTTRRPRCAPRPPARPRSAFTDRTPTARSPRPRSCSSAGMSREHRLLDRVALSKLANARSGRHGGDGSPGDARRRHYVWKIE